MTPYAEQAEQARERLVEFQKDLEELNAKAKIGEPSWGKMLYANYITHKQERIIKALDTLARVEAVAAMEKKTSSRNPEIIGFTNGFNEALHFVAKALEGE